MPISINKDFSCLNTLNDGLIRFKIKLIALEKQGLNNQLIDIKLGDTVVFENINVNKEKIVELIINNDPNKRVLEYTIFKDVYNIIIRNA